MNELSDLQQRCLVAMLALEDKHQLRYRFTANEIGSLLRLPPVYQSKWRSQTKGAAQRVIQPLVKLRERGLIAHARRDDGRSGTAFTLCPTGRETAQKLRAQGVQPCPP